VHAAALKHVDLTETNWAEAVKTNVFGTANILDVVDAADIPSLINISTDKAADPVGMLGWTKRLGEQLVSSRSHRNNMRRYSVRFGNVLGSSGSVAEVFMEQIANGGPLTITHRDATRYFMSREEAAELVLVTNCIPYDSAQKSSLFVLEMGEQIPIKYLATQMIEWAGLVPNKDIQIVEKGLRPGERIAEKLVGDGEVIEPTTISMVKTIVGSSPTPEVMSGILKSLEAAVASNDRRAAEIALKRIDRAKLSPNPVYLSVAQSSGGAR
jgi:FlaA1/EpsC-like NDP-sugar epimerase